MTNPTGPRGPITQQQYDELLNEYNKLKDSLEQRNRLIDELSKKFEEQKREFEKTADYMYQRQSQREGELKRLKKWSLIAKTGTAIVGGVVVVGAIVGFIAFKVLKS